jgi:hypothetical protein
MLIFNCSKSAAEFFASVRNDVKTSPVEIPENKKIEDDSKTFFLPEGGKASHF